MKIMLEKYDDEKNLRDNVILVTFGFKNKFDATHTGFEWIHLGNISDDRLVRLIYYASDVFACPSIDDVGPMMINEAFMCRIPIVAFDSGVGCDLIKQNSNGFVAELFNKEQFADGLYKCLMDERIEKHVSKNSGYTDQCSQEVQASKYLQLFNKLINSGDKNS